jgi:hypothetical protein
MRLVFLPKSMTACIILCLCLMLVAMPLSANMALAGTVEKSNQDTQTGCADGERQAQSDISGGTWFAIGCLAGLIGYLIAMSEPNPPAMQLMGKSPEYVAAYTDCYRKKGKNIKSKNALTGCLVGTGATIVLYAILIAAASDESSSSF